MKKGLHPQFKDCTITCACGYSFTVKSNKDSHFVEQCSNCSPAYTGKNNTLKQTGSVEKFKKKYNLN